MSWTRIRDRDKLAFREDLQADPTLTDLQKRMIGVIAQNWNGARMDSECSLTFLAAGAGTSKHTSNKYRKSLAESGRVSIKREATFTESALWGVNWFFRGSAWVRQNNDGKAILDCRKTDVCNPGGLPPQDACAVSGDSPPTGGPIPTLKGSDNSPPSIGVGPVGATPGGAEESEEESGNPHKPKPGFAKWTITHAEYGDDDMFIAHLRSGKGKKFHLRLNVESDSFASLDEALHLDGELPAVGEMMCMSIAKPTTFMRAAPAPWHPSTILAGQPTERGGVIVQMQIDGFARESTMHLTADDAARLAAVCGGEDEAVGARVRYRLMPDDTMQFRLIAAHTKQELTAMKRTAPRTLETA